MNKILEAMKKMASKPDNITSVTKSNDNEIFFMYNNKYCWGMLRNKRGDQLTLYYYPYGDPSDLIHVSDWEDVEMRSYSENDFTEPEANSIFEALYAVLDGKLYDLDSVLNEILDDF